MIFLLDTNALLWWLDNPEILCESARKAISDPANSVLLSSVSIVEIVTKQSSGKLNFNKPWEPAIEASRFTHLSFSFDHARAVQNLPLIHKDPFDRMLIAQAVIEKATLITGDKTLVEYDIPIILV